GVGALDRETHDRTVAAISHLPHVAAWALVDAVGRFEPGALAFAARGFRDTTRIAASDPPMWRDVLLANADAVRASLVPFRAALDDLERLLAAGDAAGIEALLARLKTTRAGLARTSASVPCVGWPASARCRATSRFRTAPRSLARWPTDRPRSRVTSRARTACARSSRSRPWAWRSRRKAPDTTESPASACTASWSRAT